MKVVELLEQSIAISKPLYHVTNTSAVESIKEKGLTLKNTTNWVKAASGKRYGSGEVYAFENEKDAHKWAARMDWEFNKDFGTGKISVVKFNGSGKWIVDESDPLTQASSEGKWLKSKTPVPASEIIEVEAFTKANWKK